MKTIIAGSRSIDNYTYVLDAIELAKWLEGITITEVVCGMARGVDTLGAMYAADNIIPIENFNPDYVKYSRWEAPKIRNTAMADYADALIAVWDGKSGGTADMIAKARNRKLELFIYRIDDF